MPDLPFSCRCGTLRGVLHGADPAQDCHLLCYCKDCRAFARHLGVLNQLEPGGGSALVQTLPARIEITAGADRIACKRLSPKGLHRWYADCCATPLANTVGTPRVPLAGIWAPLFADRAALGPVVTRAFTRFALPGGPKKDTGVARALGLFLRRSAAAYLSGEATRSPFFDARRQPVAAPTVLSREERRAAGDPMRPG